MKYPLDRDKIDGRLVSKLERGVIEDVKVFEIVTGRYTLMTRHGTWQPGYPADWFDKPLKNDYCYRLRFLGKNMTPRFAVFKELGRKE